MYILYIRKFQQKLVFVLALIFILQNLNCNLSNLGPDDGKDIPINKTLQGKELSAEGGYLVTFHKLDERLLADVSLNPPESSKELYTGLEIIRVC